MENLAQNGETAQNSFLDSFMKRKEELNLSRKF